ncbi:hypothetical protein L361_04983 [Enterobacter sp. MGH 15]|nr:hypothetical protein L361_04983 [Enterobacter sp. MGH 15]EUM57489.1 hypothetical protein L359_08466 [Enterobacter hormaechei subsp. hoffmannii MGH 13]
MTFNVEFDERAFKEWNQPDCMVIWLAALK